MKKLLTLIVLIFLTAALYAQRAAQLATTLTDRLKTELRLDSTQLKKVGSINETFINNLMDAFGSTGDRREKAQKFKEAKEVQENSMKEVLTAAQWTDYEKYKAEQKEKLADAAAEKISDAVTLSMQEKLKLTTAQATNAYDVNSKAFKQILSNMMNEDERGFKKLQAIKQASQERNDKMKSILNEEQFKQYQQMNEEFQKKIRQKAQERKKL